MEKDRGIWVYDIETLAGFFCLCAKNPDTKVKKSFVIHKDKDEHTNLIDFIYSCRGMIGYNSHSFDYPIIHYLLVEYPKWIKEAKINFLHDKESQEIINLLYNKAQEIINFQDVQGKYNPNLIKEKDFIIPQMDLYKQWHYNNSSRRTGLKALEISMNYPNVVEMPIHHSIKDITLKQIDEIVEYCFNDVEATEKFYEKSFDKIELRKSIKSKYNLPCISWNNGKIGEELILKLYCEKTGKNPWDVKKLRTKRSSINLSETIPSNIIFKSKEFKKLIEFYNNKVITETKASVDYKVIYKGLKYFYGTGGIHASFYSGVYESNKEYIIKSLDVSSLYPSLPIVYKFTIEHLGEEFLNIYENSIVKVRLSEKAKPKEQQDKSIIDGYKESANVPYGKSNDINSFLYDPLYSMKTTISGQLVLTMLCERLSEINNSQILMVNTKIVGV